MGGQNKNAQQQQALGNTAAATSQGAANTFGAQNQGLFSTLYGSNGTGGNVGAMANPSSLNVNSPTGPYALMYNQAKAQGATNLAQANQQVDQQAGNAGFGAGAPSGYTGFLKSQNALSNAGNNGQLFSQFAGQSYQDALNNFWKANQMMGTQAGTSGNQQNAAQGQTNSTYTNLYGATPKATTAQVVGGDIMSGVGDAAGVAAACLCEGTRLLMADSSSIAVENLVPGMFLAAQNGKKNRIKTVIRIEGIEAAKIEMVNGITLSASKTHTLVLPLGGYARVEESLMQHIRTAKGPSIVRAMVDLGKQTVYQIFTDGSHDYCANSVWCLE